MRTTEEFNEKYKVYLDGQGMLLQIPSILAYVDQKGVQPLMFLE